MDIRFVKISQILTITQLVGNIITYLQLCNIVIPELLEQGQTVLYFCVKLYCMTKVALCNKYPQNINLLAINTINNVHKRMKLS